MVRIPPLAQALCRVTPLIWAAPLGCHLKLESIQRTGSCFLRGAAVKLARMAPLDRAQGIITASAGNHGLGMACAGRALGVAVRVVVPESAPRCKREGISGFGGEIVRHGAGYDDAEKMGRRLAAVRDTLFISPSEDTDLIEGNGGWVGSELLGQCKGLRRVVAPVGCGGLAAGLATELVPEGIEVVGVSPAAHCAMAESLKADRALTEYGGGKTVCEELEGGVGWRSFRTIKRYLPPLLLVEEADIIDAVRYAYRTLGLVVEASAAVVIAAVRKGLIEVDAHTVLLIAAGNVDAEVLRAWLEGKPAPDPTSQSGEISTEVRPV